MTFAVGPKPGYADEEQLSLFFDLGSKEKHERVMLTVDPTDFAALINAMMQVDREKVITAFAASVLANSQSRSMSKAR